MSSVIKEACWCQHLCIQLYTHTYATHAHTYAHAHTHTYALAQKHAHTRTHANMHTYARTRACIRMYVQLIGPMALAKARIVFLNYVLPPSHCSYWVDKLGFLNLGLVTVQYSISYVAII
jgi:hypothetical protein